MSAARAGALDKLRRFAEEARERELPGLHADLIAIVGDIDALYQAACVIDGLAGGRKIRDRTTVHTIQVRASDLFDLQEALYRVGGSIWHSFPTLADAGAAIEDAHR
jgi:hypothetical protein